MAATVTYDISRGPGGKAIIRVLIVETSGTTVSEVDTGSIPIPNSGLVYLQSFLVSGSATSIQPALGKASGWTALTMDDIDQVTPAAAYINEGSPVPYSFKPNQTAKLYVRNTPNSGSNNVIHTLLTIVEL